MTEKDGMYVLVGQPKATNVVTCVKEMKFAILLVDKILKVYLLPNTRAATEVFHFTCITFYSKPLNVSNLKLCTQIRSTVILSILYRSRSTFWKSNFPKITRQNFKVNTFSNRVNISLSQYTFT